MPWPFTYPSPPSTAPSAPPLNPDPNFPRPPRPTVSSFSRPLTTSFLLHTGLAFSTHALGAAFTSYRLDAKDVIWPGGMLLDAWVQAVGMPMYFEGRSIGDVLAGFTWRERLLLTGITTHSLRLMTYLANRASKRGHDDPRYAKAKLQPNWYIKSLYTQFLPEAVFQTLICIPFTAPFSLSAKADMDFRYTAPWSWTDTLSIFLWTAGFAMEALADYQLSRAKKTGKVDGKMMKDGVWSIVRHPNYLSNILIQASYPLLLLSTPLSHPLLFLGPVTNYIFLRFLSGDAETETYQEQRYHEVADYTKLDDLDDYRRERNAVWPGKEAWMGGPWAWIVLALGSVGVGVEKILRGRMAPQVL